MLPWVLERKNQIRVKVQDKKSFRFFIDKKIQKGTFQTRIKNIYEIFIFTSI